MVDFNYYLSLINETKEADEILKDILYWKPKEIINKLNNNNKLKLIGEGSSRNVYLIKSRRTILKVVNNITGFKQNKIESKENQKYNLVTPKIIKIFTRKDGSDKIIAIESEYIENQLINWFKEDCLRYLKMDYRTFMEMCEKIQKKSFNIETFFNEKKLAVEFKKINIDNALIQLNYTKKEFTRFTKSKWFMQFTNLLIDKNIYLQELNGNNIGITKGRIVILDTGK